MTSKDYEVMNPKMRASGELRTILACDAHFKTELRRNDWTGLYTSQTMLQTVALADVYWSIELHGLQLCEIVTLKPLQPQ